ncbi:MAG: hypothetical protein WB564_04740 [Dehalococcoidia bacterium]
MDRNIAVVGCGYWGKNLVRNLVEHGALHTICDSNSALQDVIIDMRGVLTFNVQDTSIMRKEYTGPWPTAVRPQLA